MKKMLANIGLKPIQCSFFARWENSTVDVGREDCFFCFLLLLSDCAKSTMRCFFYKTFNYLGPNIMDIIMQSFENAIQKISRPYPRVDSLNPAPEQG